MDEQKLAYVKAELQAGKKPDEIRQGLISEGLGSSGFDDIYATVSKELGIEETEKKPTAVPGSFSHSAPVSQAVPDGELPSILDSLRFAASLLAARFGAILGTFLVYVLVAIMFAVVPDEPSLYLHGTPFLLLNVVVQIFGIIISIISSFALLYVLVKADEGINYLQALSWSFGRFGAVLWLSILTGVISVTGYAAFIIPGIAFSVYSVFSYFILMEENQQGMGAIIRSADLVVGKFWGVALRLLFIVVLSLPVVLLITVLDLILTPTLSAIPFASVFIAIPIALLEVVFAAFTIGFLLHIYQIREAYKNFFDESAYKSLRLSFWSLFVFGLVVPAAAIFLGIWQPQLPGDMFKNDYNNSFNSIPVPVSEDGENFDDFLAENRVNTAYNASTIYFAKIRTYEGVCNDVVYEEPAKCLSTETTVVAYTPLSDGRYYCRDSSGYKNYQNSKPTSGRSCR